MNDREYLKRAVTLALSSREPVGCAAIIVFNGEIISEEYNSQHSDGIAVNHAEIKAIISANKKMGKMLKNTTAYCSCEPCAMCLVALSYAKVSRIVFNKTMRDLFPNDPQSKLDPYKFVDALNYTPELIQVDI